MNKEKEVIDVQCDIHHYTMDSECVYFINRRTSYICYVVEFI